LSERDSLRNVVLGKASFAAGSAILAALIAAPGCGGSAFTAADGGTARDAASDVVAQDAASDVAGHDAEPTEAASMETGPPMCILPPNGVDGEGPFCALLAAKNSACGECEACRQLDANDCVTLGDTLSEGFKSALQACVPRLGCGDLSSLTNNPCVRDQLAAMQPTSAQLAAQMAYCQACGPANQAACNGFFDLTPDAGANTGFGIWALVLNDALDQQIVSTCSSTTTPHCDALGYGVCGALVFCGKAPHSHCPHGLCNP
jgi:hypothetical protein